jgi:hypothetical protein
VVGLEDAETRQEVAQEQQEEGTAVESSAVFAVQMAFQPCVLLFLRSTRGPTASVAWKELMMSCAFLFSCSIWRYQSSCH